MLFFCFRVGGAGLYLFVPAPVCDISCNFAEK